MNEHKLILEINAQNKHSFGRTTQQIVEIVKNRNSEAVVTRSGDSITRPKGQCKAYTARVDITNPIPDAIEALLQMELLPNVDLKIIF